MKGFVSMPRIMGLDVGSKTIGVAVSDELGWTAQGVKTIYRKSLDADMAELDRLIAEYQIGEIMIGLPLNCLLYTSNISMKKIRSQASKMTRAAGHQAGNFISSMGDTLANKLR